MKALVVCSTKYGGAACCAGPAAEPIPGGADLADLARTAEDIDRIDDGAICAFAEAAARRRRQREDP